MATAKFIDDARYEVLLSKMSQKYGDIIKEGLWAALGVLTPEIRKNLKASIGDKGATELINALGITPVKPNKVGVWSAHIGFDGYQKLGRKGIVAFQLIARGIESGVKTGPHKRPAKPFAAPAIADKREEAWMAFKRGVNAKIRELMDDAEARIAELEGK